MASKLASDVVRTGVAVIITDAEGKVLVGVRKGSHGAGTYLSYVHLGTVLSPFQSPFPVRYADFTDLIAGHMASSYLP